MKKDQIFYVNLQTMLAFWQVFLSFFKQLLKKKLQHLLFSLTKAFVFVLLRHETLKNIVTTQRNTTPSARHHLQKLNFSDFLSHV
jgi:hypothetical protein